MESNTSPITYRGVVYPWHCDQMGVHLDTIAKKATPFPEHLFASATSMIG